MRRRKHKGRDGKAQEERRESTRGEESGGRVFMKKHKGGQTQGVINGSEALILSRWGRGDLSLIHI